MRPCIFERPQPENDQGLLSENWDLIFKSKMCVYIKDLIQCTWSIMKYYIIVLSFTYLYLIMFNLTLHTFCFPWTFENI